MRARAYLAAAALAAALLQPVPSPAQETRTYPLQSAEGLVLKRVTAAPAEVNGRQALRVEIADDAQPARPGDQATFAVVPVPFRNGVVEVELLSRLNGKGPPDARAFAGLAYRVSREADRFEAVYLRPMNGRALNPPPPRNARAVQYFAYPDWTFDRLRRDYPDGRYESGADIEPNRWATLRIEVEEGEARAFVDGAPVLTIREPKGAPGPGAVGLWVDVGTEAFFRNLRVTAR